MGYTPDDALITVDFTGTRLDGLHVTVHDVETDIAQKCRHRFGVDRRVGKRRHVLVGAVADHKRDPLVGERRIGANEKCCD